MEKTASQQRSRKASRAAGTVGDSQVFAYI